MSRYSLALPILVLAACGTAVDQTRLPLAIVGKGRVVSVQSPDGEAKFAAQPACGHRLASLRDGIATFEPLADDTTTVLRSPGGEAVFRRGHSHWFLERLLSGSAKFTFAEALPWSLEWWQSTAAPPTFRSSCYLTNDGSAVERAFDLRAPDGGHLTLTLLTTLDADGVLRFTSKLAYPAQNATSMTVAYLEVPRLRAADQGPTSELLLGIGGGMRIVNPAVHAVRHNGKPYSARYPFPQTLRQTAYSSPNQQAALVLSTTGRTRERFTFQRFTAGAEAGGVFLATGQDIPDPHKVQTWSSPIESHLTIVPCLHSDSCIWDTADRYRRQVETEGWLENRAQDGFTIDAVTLLGAASALNPEPPPYEAFRIYMDALAQRTGSQPGTTLSIWFDWHDNIFDHRVPAHLPGRGGFVTALQQARADGFVVVPYTNTAIFSEDHPMYSTLRIAGTAATVDKDGDLRAFTEPNGTLSPVLDYATDLPQKFFPKELFEPLLRDGVGGIYLDFFPNVSPCYARNHGHPLGGGAEAVTGVRKFVGSLGQQLATHGEKRLLSAEWMAEYLVDRTSAANWHRKVDFARVGNNPYAGHIGWFDTVYRDRLPMTTLSAIDMPGAPNYVLARNAKADGDPSLVALELDKHFVHNGWAIANAHVGSIVWRPMFDPARPQITSLTFDPDFHPITDAYDFAVRLRRKPELHPLLARGRIGPPPRNVVVDKVDAAFGDGNVPEQRGAVPAVYAQVFVAQDGSYGLSLFNWTDKPKRYRATLLPTDYGAVATSLTTISGTWQVIGHAPNDHTVYSTDLNRNPELIHVDQLIPPRVPLVLLYKRVD